ncbi:sigma-70 family RNA polymerase sigma factor [Planctomycetota bacterium]
MDLDIQGIRSRIQSGDYDAFRLVVRHYGLMLRGYLAAQAHHIDEVDDLSQEVFIAAFRNINRFDTKGDFGSWLRGIARNKLMNHFRSSARRASALSRLKEDVADVIREPLEVAAAEQKTVRITRLLHCIEQLPDRLRRVVRGGLEGRKPMVLAQEFSTTIGAIYALHYRANKMLRQCMALDEEY